MTTTAPLPIFGLPCGSAGVPTLPPWVLEEVAPPSECMLMVNYFLVSGPTRQFCKEQKMTISSFCGLPAYSSALTCVDAFVGGSNLAPPRQAGVTGAGECGRETCTSKDLAESAAALGVDLVVPICSAFPLDDPPTAKRRRTAEARNALWEADLKAIHPKGLTSLVGACLTVYEPPPPSPADGGNAPATTATPPAPAAPPAPLQGVLSVCNLHLCESPTDRATALRMVQARAPACPVIIFGHHILDAVDAFEVFHRNGVLFVSAWPWQLAFRGHAILRHATAAESATDGPIVDFWDPKHRTNNDPIAPNCPCPCCRRHSRAYLHHLLCVHEMNSELLLAAHNVYTMMSMLRELKSDPVNAAAALRRRFGYASEV